MKYIYTGLMLVLFLQAWPVLAADVDADVTMSVIEDSDGANEERFVQDIALPDPASDQAFGRSDQSFGNEVSEQARENSDRGAERANEARQPDRGNGRDQSEGARDGNGNPGMQPDRPGGVGPGGAGGAGGIPDNLPLQ